MARLENREAAESSTGDSMEASGEEVKRRPLVTLFGTLLIFVMLPLFIVAIAWVLEGQLIAEKAATGMVRPGGMIWNVLFTASFICFWKRLPWLGALLFLAWTGYSVAGNSYFAAALMRSLEEPYMEEHPLYGEPVDVLIVLGGGTLVGPTGEVQLASAGDRVMTAARMYHRGKARKIICTGEYPESANYEVQIGQQSAQLLIDVGVPEDQIIILRGRNTKEELIEVKAWLDDHPTNRIGLLTSAWHMRRAMKQAEANELKVRPIPCHFVSSGWGSVLSFIPDNSALDTTGDVLHEYLGALVGR